jgi:hypothetical protein
MKDEKFQINIAPGTEKAEIILREVSSVNELPVKAPIKVDISGTLESVLGFLTKRKDQEEQINQKLCHIIVDREEMSLLLVTNENDEYKSGLISGHIEVHPKFKEFGVNSVKTWEPNLLGQFFKMNRACFANKDENMNLVTILKNFQAKVNTQIEKTKSDNGDFADNYNGVVQSNLPGAFKLKMPLFKGHQAEEFEVEFYASVNGRSVLLQLCSPAAQETLDLIKDQLIDEQIDKIRELTPDIAIIEQ